MDDDEVQFHAFDMLVSDGDDIRKLPLSMRKTNLARLLRGGSTASTLRRLNRARSVRTCFAMLPDGAGRSGLETSREFLPGGRFDRWIKVKNRSHPAFSRVMDHL